MRITRHGFRTPIVAIVGCVHGDEKIGAEVIKILQRKLKAENVSIKYILANEEAFRQNKRFIESDLNRSFPGDFDGTREQEIAYSLMGELGGVSCVVDIHSTTASVDDFIITVGETKLASYFPLKRVVDMSGFASGVSLIENVMSGISIEYSKNTSADAAVTQVKQFLVNLGLVQGQIVLNKQEKYEVYGVLEKTPSNKDVKLQNFVETTLGGETFVPILYGEKAYKDVLCLKARCVV